MKAKILVTYLDGEGEHALEVEVEVTEEEAQRWVVGKEVYGPSAYRGTALAGHQDELVGNYGTPSVILVSLG